MFISEFPIETRSLACVMYFSVCVVVGCTARGSVRTVVHPRIIGVYGFGMIVVQNIILVQFHVLSE